MSDILSRECDRLIAKIQADMAQQEIERAARNAAFNAACDRLDEQTELTLQAAKAMSRLVGPIDPNEGE
jgi:hypothetical protein